MFQPELLCGPVAFDGRLIQGRDHVKTQRIPHLLKFLGKAGIVFQRSPKGGERDLQLSTRHLRTGSLQKPIEKFALLCSREFF